MTPLVFLGLLPWGHSATQSGHVLGAAFQRAKSLPFVEQANRVEEIEKAVARQA